MSEKNIWISYENGRADAKFIDDLIAADRFKTFLIGTGEEVSETILNGLGELISSFEEDIERFERYRGLVTYPIEIAEGIAREAGETSKAASIAISEEDENIQNIYKVDEFGNKVDEFGNKITQSLGLNKQKKENKEN